jgi:seryl-tRNA synthetase
MNCLQQSEQTQEKTRLTKRNQKKRITSYLSGTTKQVEKHGNQINKLMKTIQFLQKQKPKQIKSTKKDQLQLKSIQQIKSQVNQLQKQVSQIQNDVRRIRSASVSGTGVATRTKIRKSTSFVTPGVKPSAKKSKSLKNTKFKRSRSSRLRMK